MKIKICIEEGCKNVQTTKDYCRLHYLKNWKKIKVLQQKKAAERLNKDLARDNAGVQIKVEGFFDTTNWDQYLRRVLLGFQSPADAPDIVQANGSLAATWADAGFIAPLDAYVPRYPQFTDVVVEGVQGVA